MSLRVLRLNDVVEKTGLKKNTIYSRMRRGEFPRNFRIGGCAATVGWLEGDIDSYIKKNVPWFVVEEHGRNSKEVLA
jgi:prophage regulatory protein